MIHPDELKPIPFFACLSEELRHRVAQNAADLHIAKGDWLIREGEVPWFFVLLEGCVEIEKQHRGKNDASWEYHSGDFFGETSILLDAPTIASLRANETSRVVRLDRMLFKEIIDSSPECSNLVVQVMMKRVTAIRDYTRDHSPLRALVVASQYDTECRDIRVFLSLNRIPYEWCDSSRETDRIPTDVPPGVSAPFVLVDRSIVIDAPLTVRKVANALGINTTPSESDYDVVVVGGGPAGLAAAVYGASEGLRVLLVERSAAGGQAGTSSRIENYLGFPNGISGDDLSSRALRQASRFGAEMVMTRDVQRIDCLSNGYCVNLDEECRVTTKSVVLATGVDWRMLEADGIDRLQGRGVLYGAARTEAATVVGKKVFIVGGGNSAGQAAIFFSSYAESVTILVRGAGLALTMSQYLIAQLAQHRNISIEPHTRVNAVHGTECLEAISTVAEESDEVRRPADALFVMIGARARTDWLSEAIQRDVNGFICTGRDIEHWSQTREPFLLETSLPGIFCAGDVRHGSIKRVSSGVGEGSMAIAFIHQFLALKEHANHTIA
ncbi:FAD-dependent oxidoreductase [Granulicella sp. L60]|uniref:FAD-dependent oxidoreductase n=1 Tax=Granulicella sp. L60 TaxID=1641866 RepID=UPI00131BEC0A|nr:FAD-dependent oxidoreductase [Granulicella sp. L60]